MPSRLLILNVDAGFDCHLSRVSHEYYFFIVHSSLKNKSNPQMDFRIVAVTINYHGAEMTRRCVLSLLDQVDRVIVVDNSNDATESVRLGKMLDSIDKENTFRRIEVITASRNLGFGGGMQLGTTAAFAMPSCVAVLLINNDAIACRGMVSALLTSFEAHGGAALIAPASSADSVPSSLWYHRFFGLISSHKLPGAFRYLNGACLLVPRIYAETKLFDSEFFMYGEDVELSWRLRRAGVVLEVLQQARYQHVGAGSARVGSLFYEYHVARAHILLTKKLALSRLERFSLLLGRAVSLPMRASVRCVRYRSLMPWRALILACLNDPPAFLK